jgi:hypothetical protein
MRKNKSDHNTRLNRDMVHETHQPRIEGFVEIRDAETGEVVLSKKNAIHYENFSLSLALTLSHQGYGHIHKLLFGNGASTVTGTGAISYFPPNTTGSEATLYNTTYSDKVVDATSLLNNDPDPQLHRTLARREPDLHRPHRPLLISITRSRRVRKRSMTAADNESGFRLR